MDSNTIIVRCLTHCVFCGGESTLFAKAEDITRYNAGAHVQDVWPEKSPDWRENYINGTHGWCFDQAFAQDDEIEGNDPMDDGTDLSYRG